MNREERMNAVFDYLLSKGCIRNQKTFAKAISSTPANISKALKGDTRVLTDNFCRRIQKAFEEISAEWMINGTGEMVVMNSNNPTTEQQPLPDYSSLMNAAIAAKDETIASLKRELEAKDALIKSLNQQVSELGYTISVLKEKRTAGYTFPMGVADDGSIQAATALAEKPAKFPSSRK